MKGSLNGGIGLKINKMISEYLKSLPKCLVTLKNNNGIYLEDGLK